MKVQAKPDRKTWITQAMHDRGWSEKTQIDITPQQVYDVHAVVIWQGRTSYQIVGDYEIISWYPSSVFEIIDHSIPSDWIANLLDAESHFAVGPEFIVRDAEALNDMVDLVPSQVAEFWERLRRLGYPIPEPPPPPPAWLT